MTSNLYCVIGLPTPYDPVAHARNVREHPEAYVTFRHIAIAATALHAIKTAPDLKALNERLQPPAKLAKAQEDTALLKIFTDAGKARKAELTV